LTTDRLVTCGGGDLEGGRLPPDDGIGDDLHAAHLHWVVPPLFCRNTAKSSPSQERKKGSKAQSRKNKTRDGDTSRGALTAVLDGGGAGAGGKEEEHRRRGEEEAAAVEVLGRHHCRRAVALRSLFFFYF